jgi:hypothetical protein
MASRDSSAWAFGQPLKHIAPSQSVLHAKTTAIIGFLRGNVFYNYGHTGIKNHTP